MNDSRKGEENNSEILPRESMPQEQRGSIIAVSYEGILPPAQELVRYNHAHPDAAHRIITMAEKQETHRQKLETIGLIFGFIIVVMVIGTGAVLIFNDKARYGSSDCLKRSCNSDLAVYPELSDKSKGEALGDEATLAGDRLDGWLDCRWCGLGQYRGTSAA